MIDGTQGAMVNIVSGMEGRFGRSFPIPITGCHDLLGMRGSRSIDQDFD